MMRSSKARHYRYKLTVKCRNDRRFRDLVRSTLDCYEQENFRPRPPLCGPCIRTAYSIIFEVPFMAIRNIVKEGDPILNKVCRPVTNFDDRLATLLDDMRETMIAADGGGLAGPQVACCAACSWCGTPPTHRKRSRGLRVQVHRLCEPRDPRGV